MATLNQDLAHIFKDMSSIYQYIGGGERFRALAYQKASRVIAGLPEDITHYIANNTLESIDGIGESTAQKIKEYVSSGKIKKYEELKKKVPHDMMDMMEIKGFGPQSLKAIREKLKINTKEEMVKALTDGSIGKLKGFGEKKVENMLRGMKLHKTIEERMLLWNALKLSEKVVAELKSMKEVKHIEVAGSIRRRKETIGDIDILLTSDVRDRKKIMNRFTSMPDIKQVLAKGDTKASVILDKVNKQVDVRIVNEDEWGAALLYFTGSKEHTVHLRTLAKQRGLKINEYGVFRSEDEKRVAGRTEEEVYKLLGFQWVPPEMREDRGELDLAAKNKIPKLVELKDIKGDMHMHSNWSDGLMDIEELARFVMKNYPYQYIVLTDHSKSERIARGMDEKAFTKQIRKIDEINKKLGKDFIKKGVEVDILADGSLDLSNELLAQLDWVVASIHVGFKDGTDRLIGACESPFVNVIGHPTGRLTGKREGYPVDWEKVFKAAQRSGTALEINSQPMRMDLNDEIAFAAREAGVALVISTDSHSSANFEFMQLGVSVARRAWCTADDILNTRSWIEVEKFKKKKLSKTRS